MTVSPPHVERSSIPTSPFVKLVQADIRNEVDAADAVSLRDPENLQAWHDELVGTIQKIDVQMSNSKAERAQKRKEYDEYVARTQAWRSSALGFRSLADKRLMEVKELMRNASDDRVEVIHLKTAIEQHRKAVAEGGTEGSTAVEPEEADRILWAAVNS